MVWRRGCGKRWLSKGLEGREWGRKAVCVEVQSRRSRSNPSDSRSFSHIQIHIFHQIYTICSDGPKQTHVCKVIILTCFRRPEHSIVQLSACPSPWPCKLSTQCVVLTQRKGPQLTWLLVVGFKVGPHGQMAQKWYHCTLLCLAAAA